MVTKEGAVAAAGQGHTALRAPQGAAERAERAVEIQLWLEWAGSKLLSLHITSPAPREPHVSWPSYANDATDGYGYTPNTLRAATPSRFEITLMDKILVLPALIPNVTMRRIVNARALVTPVSFRYVYSWAKIGALLHSDRGTVARLHAKGIGIIVTTLPKERASALQQSFNNLVQ